MGINTGHGAGLGVHKGGENGLAANSADSEKSMPLTDLLCFWCGIFYLYVKSLV